MKISIMGCGWLGLPLGTRLASMGLDIQGSTRSREKFVELQKADIIPFQIHTNDLLSGTPEPSFWECDLLVVNIPPGRSRGDVRSRHPREIRAIRSAMESGSARDLIFVSSTSVYAPTGGAKREEDAGNEPASSESGEALLEAERILLSSGHFDTTILRLGGLYGYNRHPARNLSGRKDLKGGEKPVNLIHRDDAVEILIRLIDEPRPGEAFNGVSDLHPTRRELYTTMARRLGVEEPRFLSEPAEKEWKVISNEKLKRTLGYSFLYPDPAGDAP